MGFNRVERVGDDRFRSFFMFSAGGYNYVIRSDGFVEIGSAQAPRRLFKLTINPKGYLEQIYYLEYQGDMLLIYEASDRAYGWGYVVRLNQKTQKVRWIAPISGYDLGPGLVEGNSLYLTAADLIAKLDLVSGTFAWQHLDLTKKYSSSFAAFDLPWTEGERVFFKEQSAKTLEVDKTTGKILNVKD
jgi:hypothetical protein